VVTAQYGGPVGKASVKIEGPKSDSATTDDKGQATFQDLPAGSYKVMVSGVAKNAARMGEGMVQVDAPPAKPAQLTVNLQ
jgi:hypothetical protein